MSGEPAHPRVVPLGDRALLVTLGDRIDSRLHAVVLGLERTLRGAPVPGVLELVPAYASLTVHFDPFATEPERLERWIRETLGRVGAGGEAAPPGRLHSIPVRYDGPDLDEVARRTGLPVSEVIARHTAREYRVYLLGFVPGWAYLGDLDPALVLPRRAEPRTRVPAGSVAIAGEQTGIYPCVTPGGWHLIGSTTVRLFDPALTPPALLAVGDRVRFVPEPAAG